MQSKLQRVMFGKPIRWLALMILIAITAVLQTAFALGISISASAEAVCGDEFSHILTVEWNVTDADASVAVTIAATLPDGSVVTETRSTPQGEVVFNLPLPGGGEVAVQVRAESESGSASASARAVLEPCEGKNPSEIRHTMTGSANFDVVRLSVAPACSYPEEIRILRDGIQIYTSYPDPFGGSGFTSFSLDESAVAPGRYTYSAEVDCKSTTGTAGPVELDLRRPPFEIRSLVSHRPWYASGEDIVIDVETDNAELAVGIDFSAIDSEYTPGAERVELRTDGPYKVYRVSYTLSQANTRPTGDYQVLLTVNYSGLLIQNHEITLRYLPQGRGTVRIPTASFVPAEWDTSLRPNGSIGIRYIDSLAGVQGRVGPPKPQLFDSTRGEPGGTRVTVEFFAPEPLPNETVWLQLAEQGSSGYLRIPVDAATPISCSRGLCTYRAEFTLQRNASVETTFRVRIVMGGDGQGGVSPVDDFSWFSDCDNDPATHKPSCPESTGLYHVFGTISYARRELVVNQSPQDNPYPKAPQYEESTLSPASVVPARDVLVRVNDGCGLYTDGYTDENGEYSILFESQCGDDDATVTVYSISAPGAGKQVALGVWTASPSPQVMGDMIDDPDKYTVVSGQVGTFNPENDAVAPESCQGGTCSEGMQLDRSFTSFEAGPLEQAGKFNRTGEVARALTIMGNAMTALDYYRQLVDPDRLPQINFVLTDEMLRRRDEPDKPETAFYNKSKRNLIYLPRLMEWSSWAAVHETGHYFDGGILVKDGLTKVNYGQWGEPMANLRAGSILGTSWMTSWEGSAAENLDVQGNWSNQENQVVPPPNLPVGEPIPQGWIWRILWDLHDGGTEISEPLDFGFENFDHWNGGGSSTSPRDHLINGVVRYYLPQRTGEVHPEYEDRGQPGPDLVDMLDGFACLYGMRLLDMEVLLREVMNYDYDFAKCSGEPPIAPPPPPAQ